MKYNFDLDYNEALLKAHEAHNAIPPHVEVLVQYTESKTVDPFTLRDQFARLLKKFHKKNNCIAAIHLFIARMFKDADIEKYIEGFPWDNDSDPKEMDLWETFGLILHYPPTANRELMSKDLVSSLISEVKSFYKIKNGAKVQTSENDK